MKKYGLFTVVSLISLCILSGTYLPMVDLPQHAGQVAVLNDALKNQSKWSSLFELNFDTPYLVGYLTWLGIYQFFDIVTSSRIIVTLAFVLFIFSVSRLSKALDSNEFVAWVAVPTFFGFAYQFGFVTFLLSLSIGIFFVIANLKWQENINLLNTMMVLVFGTCLYFSHMLSFVFFCPLAFLLICVKSKNIKDILKFFSIYLIFALYLVRYAMKGDNLSDLYTYGEQKFIWHGIWLKLQRLFSLPFTASGESYHIVIGLILFVLAIILGLKLSRNIEKYIPLLVFSLVWFLLPSFMMDTFFIYERYSVLFFVCYYLIFEPKEIISTEQSLFDKLSKLKPLFYLVILTLMVPTISSIMLMKKESRYFGNMIERLPENKRVLSLMFDTHSFANTHLSVYVQFGSWYQAQKHGWVDYNFAWFHPQIVRYQRQSVPKMVPSTEWYPEYAIQFCQDYDALLIRSYSQNVTQFMAQTPCKNFKLSHNESVWYYYEK